MAKYHGASKRSAWRVEGDCSLRPWGYQEKEKSGEVRIPPLLFLGTIRPASWTGCMPAVICFMTSHSPG